MSDSEYRGLSGPQLGLLHWGCIVADLKDHGSECELNRFFAEGP